MEELNLIIGNNLSAIRNKRKLSLDEVANLTGVSKAMLAQIEKGKSNPTVSTLWKISTGLKVPFSSFMEKEKINYKVVDSSKITPISEENNKMKIYPIFPFDIKNNFEILKIDLEKECIHSSEKHAEGVEEYIIVTEGTLKMNFESESVILKKETCIKFDANIMHTYENIGDEKCTFQNIIVYKK
ncbi:helix-turn-helix domain-containing protein [Hathewaya limosa]|uniref:Transcriptional regulator with XRE-family HTH domain n=1 Tax=Hathewaya limosa TaxID=1536 RepID=A0ABU0JS34_HATLI|nr:XRE family transcriptional regulator [Hathewaya limosa]AWZ49005.1 DNA-binding protein [Clostridiaceae bacterium 14S0207]MDQ0479885.1 transcriptional regulator with XRE-family HTH domain [Hathewaya limosa]